MSAALALLLFAAASGPVVDKAAIKATDAACKAALARDDGRQKIYASESVLPARRAREAPWREFASSDDLRAWAEDHDAPNTQASVWTTPDGTTMAVLFFQSDSGDWMDDVEYCFRADGSLARMHDLAANVSADETWNYVVHFDATGAVLVSDAQRVEPKSKKGKHVRSTKYDGSVPVYLTTAALPFLSAAPRTTTPARPAPDGGADAAPRR